MIVMTDGEFVICPIGWTIPAPPEPLPAHRFAGRIGVAAFVHSMLLPDVYADLRGLRLVRSEPFAPGLERRWYAR